MSEHNINLGTGSSQEAESKKMAVSLKRRIQELREVAKRMRADDPTTPSTLQDKLDQLSENE